LESGRKEEIMRNIGYFTKMKNNNTKISMITAYDYSSGKITEAANIDCILVGDSLGMVELGYENTLEVTIDDIIYHTKAVRRGAKDTFIISDMPYMSYHLSLKDTKLNASRLIIEGKANAVKLEGGTKSRLEAISAIVDCEIPVVAHLGLTPQSVNKFGGFKIQGKTNNKYNEILNQALEIQKAGAFMLVLEGIPESLGKEISEKLSIPTIGIGAGRYTDGQVLVWHDILGLSDLDAKFSKKYIDLDLEIKNVLKEFDNDVKNKIFPTKKNVYFPIENEKTEQIK
jgi:3-methyl-2-oxobutanoate hydroxymethyltransferase